MMFLKMDDITKTYEKAPGPCIENLDFEVAEGDIVVILGPSGCGKTTVLKMIAGLEKQDSGSVSIDGEVMDGIPPDKRPIAMVFQKSLLFRNMSVEQNVNYAPRVKQTMSKTELKEEVNRMLELVDMEGYNDRKATQLSGGQEQRVSLARALITKPKLLLLDEPFSALDAELRIEMRKSVREICKNLGLTVIFVTHDQQEAVAIGDRVALMMDGKIIQYGSPDIFYTQPATKKVASFFGWKNLIPAKQDGDSVTSALGTFKINGRRSETGNVLLAIRPEAATYSEEGAFKGTVKSASYMGAKSEYAVDCNGIRLDLLIRSRSVFLEGEEISFDLDTDMMWVVEEEENIIPTDGPVVKKRFLDRFKKNSIE